MDYKDLFVSEAKEHIQNLNQLLLELEHNPTGDTLNSMFRSAHTIKGSAAAMELNHIANLAHEMENVLDSLRQGKMKVNSTIVDVLFECLDAIEGLIKDVEEGKESGDCLSIISKLKATENEEKPEEKEADKNISYNITVYLNKECTMKGIRAMMILKTLGQQGEIIQTVPDGVEDGNFDSSFEVVIKTGESPEKLKKSVLIADVENVVVKNYEKEKKEKEQIKSLRVEVKTLDSLMNLVGELVINKIRLAQVGEKYRIKELNEALGQLNLLTTNLQDEIMRMRMVPVEHVFNRFPRMIRDISNELSKEVELVIEGRDIELDRTILDELFDPLVHLIRNSLDHGLEAPAEREASGKSRKGNLKLTAERERNNIIIRLEDDGKGIDSKKIKEAVVRKGVISKEEAESLNERDAQELVFIPGFSTAEKVTEISGRGVGLDIVRSRIEALGGSVKLESQPRIGTTVTLQLPLTMAIIQAMMVSVGEEVYAIPLTNVLRTTSLKESDITTINGDEVLHLNGEIVPLIRLGKLFGSLCNNKKLDVVIVEKDGRPMGMMVDHLINQQEIVIKSLGALKGMEGFAGATILGDGKVGMILDVASIVRKFASYRISHQSLK